ncbi:general substrate transporter [Xylogone sp. PMI_703]|nr:general substrate transporter [Xylogone sp. PMI_703]
MDIPTTLLVVDKPQNRWKTLLASKTFLFWSLYSFLSLVVIGFDLSLPGQVLSMPAFNKEFGRIFDNSYVTPALWQSLWNGLSQLGQCIGALLFTPIANYYGRRWSYIVASCTCIVGIALQFASHEWKLMLVGRLVNGLGLGMCFTFAPLYIGENCFPELRGFFLVFLNWSITYGQFFAALTARWSETLSGNAAWRVPIAMQWLFPVIALILIPFFPESPYFILTKYKDGEKARTALDKLYGKHNVELIERRMRELQIEIAVHDQISEGVTWKDCLRQSNLERTGLTFLTGATQQVIGTSFIFSYFGYFVALFGVAKPFDMSVVFYLAGIIGNSMAFYLIERIGRRTLIVQGLLIMWIMLILIGGLAFASGSNIPNTLVALFVVWGWIYNLTLGAGALVLSSEISDLSLRAYTQPLVTIANAGVGWISNFVSPYLINPDEADLGAKVGLIFGGLGFLSWIWAYFYVPETNSFTYAELAYLFKNKTSRRKFPEAIAKYRQNLARSGVMDENVTAGVIVTADGEKETVEHAESVK